MNKLIIIIVIVLAAGGGYYLLTHVPLPSPSVSPTAVESPSGSPTPTPDGKPNITVTTPVSGDSVTNPITVTGTARVFENTFAWALEDSTGKVIANGNSMTDAKDAGLFGNYTIKIVVPTTATKDLTVKVFEYSAKDGAVTNLVAVPVKLSDTTTISLKYALFKKDQTDCKTTVLRTRKDIKTQEPAFVALTELLKGPDADDTASGYVTTIPENVRLNSVTIKDGVATADFNETLEGGVGGACRVSGITAQITNTLKQFTSVKSVVISINGKTEGILQP